MMQSPDHGRTHARCHVTASHHTAFDGTQQSLNDVVRSGHLMHVPPRVAKRGLAIQSGKAVPFAKGILGFRTEGTQQVDHLFGQTTDRFEALGVLIPGHDYMVSCFAKQADFPDYRKAFDRIIGSFKLVAFK